MEASCPSANFAAWKTSHHNQARAALVFGAVRVQPIYNVKYI